MVLMANSIILLAIQFQNLLKIDIEKSYYFVYLFSHFFL